MSTESNKSNISIVYDELERQEGVKGPWDTTNKIVRKIGILNTEVLASNLNDLCRQFGNVFKGVSTTVNEYELQSFEIVVDVTAKGDIRLIGSVGSELKGGLKLIFTRQKDRD